MNRKKIESTVRSQNLCSPVTRKNKPGAVKNPFVVRTFRMRNGRFGAGGSRNRSAGHIGCRDTLDGRLLRRADPSADLRPHDPPYALEVTFNKTTHVIFPSAIRYVDLGSADLLAAKADGTENVLRSRPPCATSRARATSRSSPRTGPITPSTSNMPTSL